MTSRFIHFALVALAVGTALGCSKQNSNSGSSQAPAAGDPADNLGPNDQYAVGILRVFNDTGMFDTSKADTAGDFPKQLEACSLELRAIPTRGVSPDFAAAALHFSDTQMALDQAAKSLMERLPAIKSLTSKDGQEDTAAEVLALMLTGGNWHEPLERQGQVADDAATAIDNLHNAAQAFQSAQMDLVRVGRTDSQVWDALIRAASQSKSGTQR